MLLPLLLRCIPEYPEYAVWPTGKWPTSVSSLPEITIFQVWDSIGALGQLMAGKWLHVCALTPISWDRPIVRGDFVPGMRVIFEFHELAGYGKRRWERVEATLPNIPVPEWFLDWHEEKVPDDIAQLQREKVYGRDCQIQNRTTAQSGCSAS